MPDMDSTTREEVSWEKYGTLPPGTRVVVTIGSVIVFDKTVPAGKQLRGRIAVEGELEAEP